MKEYWRIAFQEPPPYQPKRKQKSGLYKHMNFDVLDKKLNQDERMQLLHSICGNSDFENDIQKYFQFLDTVEMFTPEVVSGWQKTLKPLEIASDFLLDSTKGIFTQSQLDRKEYETDRIHTTTSFSGTVPIHHEGDQLSFIEKLSIHREDDPLNEIVDDLERVDGFNKFNDIEKQISYLVCMDMTKVSIQKELGLSESQLLTHLKRMGNKMRPDIVEPTTAKTCRKCRIEKEIASFHKDKRNKDGLHSYCKECIKASRKKAWKSSA